MYRPFDHVDQPLRQTILWRYMDLASFLALGEYRALFFPRLSTLTDPFEGQLTLSAFEKMHSHLDDYARRHNFRAARDLRERTCVSCWHASDVESAAMWDLYVKTGQGIAVRTTFERFRESLPEPALPVFGGMVRYVDFDSYDFDIRHLYDFVFLKRRNFEHEREFRAIVLPEAPPPSGVSVPVDPDKLIESVYLAPSARCWLEDLLTRLIARLGLACPIFHSRLQEYPRFFESGEPGKHDD